MEGQEIGMNTEKETNKIPTLSLCVQQHIHFLRCRDAVFKSKLNGISSKKEKLYEKSILF